jgi:2-polyprenyl-6-hydroxyphenyl methylase / 3-demethylubiquinone-9 3-methyltransferase
LSQSQAISDTDRPVSTVDAGEVARFSALAATWWDLDGPFRPLHKFNPTRLAYIRDRLTAHFGRDKRQKRPLEGLRLLDIGCGGGLVSEPMARLGATVVAIDAAVDNIGTARAHAAEMGLSIDYRATTAEDLVAAGETFDAVLALEIVEHVSDVPAFTAALGRLTEQGGILIAATLNRTPQAFLKAIIGAEYVLRWMPRGTHDWRKFMRPSELANALRRSGLTVNDVSGITYSPLADQWRRTNDLTVNYMMSAVKT